MARARYRLSLAPLVCALLAPAPAQVPETPEPSATAALPDTVYPDCRNDYRERNLALSRARETTRCIARLDAYHAEILVPFRAGLDADPPPTGEREARVAAYDAAEARYRDDRAFLEERYCRYAECEDYAPSAVTAERDAADGILQCGDGSGSSIFLEGLIGQLVNRVRRIGGSATSAADSFVAFACRLEPEEQLLANAATEEVVAREEVGATAQWVSTTRENVSGSSTITGLESQPSGAICLDITDIVIIEGEETRRTKRLCREPGGTRYVLQA